MFIFEMHGMQEGYWRSSKEKSTKKDLPGRYLSSEIISRTRLLIIAIDSLVPTEG